MQSFVTPMEINVLSDSRIRVPEESRNLSDVEFLVLEHVREEMPQRMMRNIMEPLLPRMQSSTILESSCIAGHTDS